MKPGKPVLLATGIAAVIAAALGWRALPFLFASLAYTIWTTAWRQAAHLLGF